MKRAIGSSWFPGGFFEFFLGQEFELFFLGLRISCQGVREIYCIWVFCIFINLIIIISSSSINISISFVALLNCLYLNPQVFAVIHFSAPSRCGERRGR